MTYFSFTTVATVGFGDLTPRSDLERLVFMWVLLFGVMMFSYVLGNFQNMIRSFNEMNKDLDESEELGVWLTLIEKFNDFTPITIQAKLQGYFQYKWNFDNNLCIQSEYD